MAKSSNKKHYSTAYQQKHTAFPPTTPQPFVLDTDKKVKLAAFVAATSAATTLVIGGAFVAVKHFLKSE